EALAIEPPRGVETGGGGNNNQQPPCQTIQFGEISTTAFNANGDIPPENLILFRNPPGFAGAHADVGSFVPTTQFVDVTHEFDINLTDPRLTSGYDINLTFDVTYYYSLIEGITPFGSNALGGRTLIEIYFENALIYQNDHTETTPSSAIFEAFVPTPPIDLIPYLGTRPHVRYHFRAELFPDSNGDYAGDVRCGAHPVITCNENGGGDDGGDLGEAS
ncbi:MAG: hypothetical protein AB1489_43015, partial [Acidobacteriota bacterium]